MVVSSSGIATLKQKLSLSFDGIVDFLRTTFKRLPDKRRGKNKQYTMEDIGLSAFSVFFMQCPSFLAHQRLMQEARGKNNAQALFQVEDIPSDNHIRSLLDEVPPSSIFGACCHIIEP